MISDEIEIAPEQLLIDIKNIVAEYKMNYIDATVYYCENRGYDIESISKIIPSPLRGLIEESAKSMKLLKKEFNISSSLPL